MVRLSKTRTTVKVDLNGASPGATSIIKGVPGYEYDKARSGWQFPLDPPTIRELAEKLQASGVGINYEAGLVAWMQERTAKAQVLSQVRESKDQSLLYEHADTLFAYQRKMVRYLVEAERALCSDKMGLGKTPESIGAIRELELRGQIKEGLYLVVAPNSALGNWRNEIRRWYDPNAEIFTVNTGKELVKPEPGWYLVNWEKTHRRERLQKVPWDVVIGDESHRMKGKDTKQSKAMRKIKSRYAFLLTGTPIKNEVTDLWAQLNFLYPQQFSSFWRFFEMYVEYTENFFGSKEVVGLKNEDRLRRSLVPIMYGRTLDEIEEQIPEVQHFPIRVDLEGDQKKAYEQMRDEFVAYINGLENEEVRAVDFRSQMLRLKQIAGSMALFQPTLPQSSKIDALFELLDSTDPSEKFVVMTQFRSMVTAVGERLSDANIGHCEMMGGGHQLAWLPGVGSKDAEDRQQLIDYFEGSDKSRVFVATLQTGGEAINLTASRYFVFMDLLWTPGDNEQAWKRIHRRGQKRACFVYRILANNTVDYSAILPTLARKQAIIDLVMNPADDY